MNDLQPLFLDLLEINHGRWRVIARSYAGIDSEDLFQEIVLQIWKSLPSFQGNAAVSTWCYRVALNTAMTWKRATKTRRNRLPIAGDVATAPATCAVEQTDLNATVHHLIQSLSQPDRAVLLLALDDVSYADMAAILGASEGALRVRVHRIKLRLAELAREVDHGI